MTVIAYLTRRTYSSPGYVRRYAVASTEVIKDDLGLTASFETISEPVVHFYLQIDGGAGCDFPLPRQIVPADAPLAFHNPAGWQVDIRPLSFGDDDLAELNEAAVHLLVGQMEAAAAAAVIQGKLRRFSGIVGSA